MSEQLLKEFIGIKRAVMQVARTIHDNPPSFDKDEMNCLTLDGVIRALDNLDVLFKPEPETIAALRASLTQAANAELAGALEHVLAIAKTWTFVTYKNIIAEICEKALSSPGSEVSDRMEVLEKALELACKSNPAECPYPADIDSVPCETGINIDCIKCRCDYFIEKAGGEPDAHNP